MSEAASRPADPATQTSSNELHSALFLDMVAQQANMALICLGMTPHPETGKHMRDMESARLFIEQLEMIESKTRGNLDKREETMLKQSLVAVRMAFVEAVNQPAPAASEPAPPAATPATAPSGPAASSSEPAPSPSSPPETGATKRFSKKY